MVEAVQYPFRRLLLRNSIWMQKLIGKTKIHFGTRDITGKDYYAVRGWLMPGMVILSRQRGNLTNLFVPGFWTHAALYAGREEVIEAVGEGVRQINLVDFMLHEDFLAVFQPKFCNSVDMLEAVRWARSKIGSEYDHMFSGMNKAYYCAELVYEAYNYAAGKKIPFKRQNTLGESAYVPSYIEDETRYWEKKWVSKNLW